MVTILIAHTQALPTHHLMQPSPQQKDHIRNLTNLYTPLPVPILNEIDDCCQQQGM